MEQEEEEDGDDEEDGEGGEGAEEKPVLSSKLVPTIILASLSHN